MASADEENTFSQLAESAMCQTRRQVIIKKVHRLYLGQLFLRMELFLDWTESYRVALPLLYNPVKQAIATHKRGCYEKSYSDGFDGCPNLRSR